MKRSCLCTLCWIITAMLPPSAHAADEARQVFDSLYSQKIKQVSSTSDRADDIALAKEMLGTAKSSGDSPKLQALLCETVSDLGSRHADGYSTAIEAMQLLADSQEALRDGARAKLIDLYSRQSRTGKLEERDASSEAMIDLLVTMGDENSSLKQYGDAAGHYRRALTIAIQRKSDMLDSVKAKLESASSRDRAVKQIARLQEKLLKDANDHATAEEIIKIFMRDLNDPASTEPFRTRVKDSRLATMSRLAESNLMDLEADDCLSMGEWYKEMAVGLPNLDAATLLEKSNAYLTRFLSFDSTTGITRTKAEVLLKDVVAMRQKIEPSVTVTSKKPTPASNNSEDIAILDAQYGADGGWVDVTAKVKKMAQKDRLVVHVGTWLVGFDPKFGANKSLKVQVKIGADERTISTADGAILVLFTAAKSSDTSPLKIVEARYGGADGWVDVTRNVRAKARTGTLSVIADMSDLGVDRDPAFGVHKNLVIFYMSKGEPLFKIVNTSEKATLP